MFLETVSMCFACYLVSTALKCAAQWLKYVVLIHSPDLFHLQVRKYNF